VAKTTGEVEVPTQTSRLKVSNFLGRNIPFASSTTTQISECVAELNQSIMKLPPSHSYMLPTSSDDNAIRNNPQNILNYPIIFTKIISDSPSGANAVENINFFFRKSSDFFDVKVLLAPLSSMRIMYMMSISSWQQRRIKSEFLRINQRFLDRGKRPHYSLWWGSE
jgi:hypothetical protein